MTQTKPTVLTLHARGFVEQLFGFELPETRGEILRFKLFEFFLLGFALHWAWQWGFQLRAIPAILVPQGLGREVDLSFLVGGWAGVANAVLVSVCAGCVLFQRNVRLALPLLVVCMHLQYVARHSLGKLTHGTHYVGLGLLMLAIAAWCMPTPSTRRRFALNATLFFMGIGYVFAAISKLAALGLRWPNGKHLWLWIQERSLDQLANLGASDLNALQRLCLEHWWLATLCLTAGLLTELSGFLLWFRRTRAFASVALIGMHLGVFVLMDILFGPFIYQLLIVGLPLHRLLERLLEAAPAPLQRRIRASTDPRL